MTSIKVEKPVVDWLNTIKGFLEWKHGKKYSLNQAMIILLAEYDTRIAIKERKISSYKLKKINEYMKKRLRQFWGEEGNIPDIIYGEQNQFFKRK